MTQSLLPCPSCNRHVTSGEANCPFCDASLAQLEVPEPVGTWAPRGLSRAAVIALGTSLSGAAAAACESPQPVYGGPPLEGPSSGGVAHGAVYGLPPSGGTPGAGGIPSGGGTLSTGGQPSSGGAPSTGGIPSAGGVYGAPPSGGTGGEPSLGGQGGQGGQGPDGQ